MSESEAVTYDNYPNYTIGFLAPFILHVEITRPEKLNSFIEHMWTQLPNIFKQVSSDPSVRAVIISGSGNQAFSSGLDVRAATENSTLGPAFQSKGTAVDSARAAEYLRRHIADFQAGLSAIAASRKPVICAIHGYCYGLGIDLAVCADVRLCASNTRFAVKEVDIGIAADIGVLSRLPKIVGNGSWVKEVCLTGRIFDAAEARREGLVSWASEEKDETPAAAKASVMAKALEIAKLLSSKSPVAVQGTKELLDWSWNRSVEDGLKYTATWNAAMLQTNDIAESIQASLEKRPGVFAKL